MLSRFGLVGRLTRLEPLSDDHVEGLVAAAAEDRSSFAYTTVPDGMAETRAYVGLALEDHAAARAVPWAVRRLSDERLVGTTRYLDLDVFTGQPPWPPRVPGGRRPSDSEPPTALEIGGTWYAASAQRTGVNTDVKLTLLTHAFEVWKVRRVTFKTDARNRASRVAIERLGARFEGIRRVHHVASDGQVRDSAYYSIIAEEWPSVATVLKARLR